MQLYGVLMIISMTLSTAYGLRCYSCTDTDPKSCTDIESCEVTSNRCFSDREEGYVAQGCLTSKICDGDMACCEGDLCNSAIPTGPSVILLLVSSAIMTLFL